MEEFDPPLQPWLAAKSMAVCFSEEKGRCLVAKRDFKRGDVVLEQEPYVSVLDADARKRRCDSCFTEPARLMRCRACKYVWYCSTSCQRKEWKLHQLECAAIVSLWNEKQQRPTPSLFLMLRLFLRRKLQEEEVIQRTATDHYGLVEALPTHMSMVGEERLLLYAQMANLVKLIGVPDDVSIKSIAENFCRFACNAHTICDEELRCLGSGLYPVVSIVNHSCSPNLVLLFEGKRAVLRAVEDTEKGSELTMSYVELGANTASRRKSLLDQYLFYCNCARCVSTGAPNDSLEDAMLEGFRCSDMSCEGVLLKSPAGTGTYACHLCSAQHLEDDLLKAASTSGKLLQLAASLASAGNSKETRKAYERAEEEQVKVWHPHSEILKSTRDSLLRLCMEAQDWQNALRYVKLTLPAYERMYPPYFPLLGLQFYCLGKLEWFVANTSEAVAALTRAHDILVVTHGRHSQSVQELSRLLNEARAEAAHLSWRSA